MRNPVPLAPFFAGFLARADCFARAIDQIPIKTARLHDGKLWGRFVPFGKGKIRVVITHCPTYGISMRDQTDPEGAYNRGFTERTAALRRLQGFTQADMARLLGIPLDRYKKYERRSPLPHYLLERFAVLTKVSLEALVTGRNRDSLRKTA